MSTQSTQFPSPIHQYDVDHDCEAVDFYWGVASGGTHAALHRARDDPAVPTPDRLMVSFATKENKLWPGVEWMVDCGGAPESIKANGGYDATLAEYAEYLRDPPRKYKRSDDGELELGRYALRDWPCEPDVREELDCTVAELQQRTLTDHIRLLDRLEDDPQVDAQPVAVLQGWTAEDYLECIDMYRDHGLLTDVVGLGSVCRRNTAEAVDSVRTIAHRVRRNLPARVDLHGFGLKQTLLGNEGVVTAFDSVDSAAWEFAIRQATRNGSRKAPPVDELAYGDWADWDDEGNPRYTWQNIQTCYQGYRNRLNGLRTDPIEPGDRVVTPAEWPGLVDRLDRGEAGDGYVLVECPCGTVIDPGRPEPVPEVGCRHCERMALNLWDRRLAARETR